MSKSVWTRPGCKSTSQAIEALIGIGSTPWILLFLQQMQQRPCSWNMWTPYMAIAPILFYRWDRGKWAGYAVRSAIHCEVPNDLPHVLVKLHAFNLDMEFNKTIACHHCPPQTAVGFWGWQRKKTTHKKKNGWGPLASFLHLRVLVPNRLHQTKHQAQDRPNIKPETQPHAAQALIPALQLIRSGTNFDSCIKSRTLRACCHCPPFSQALMAAL